jgi:hypothetical protein
MVTLSMRSGRGLCGTLVDSGKLEFKLKDGSTREDWLSYQPSAAGLNIGKVAPVLGVAEGVNFVLWSNALSQPDFSIDDFNGVRLHLFNGPVEVVTYDIPGSSFAFTRMLLQRQFLNVQVYNTAIPDDVYTRAFYRSAEASLANPPPTEPSLWGMGTSPLTPTLPEADLGGTGTGLTTPPPPKADLGEPGFDEGTPEI